MVCPFKIMTRKLLKIQNHLLVDEAKVSTFGIKTFFVVQWPKLQLNNLSI